MNEQRVGKSVAAILGAICAAIAIALVALLILMMTAPSKGPDHLVRLALLISVVAPFALVFSAFALGVYSRSVRGEPVMYSPAGWRVLAFLSAAIGITCAILSGPLAILLPGALAVVLLAQDKWIRALLFGGGA